ncbi:MAG: hypothetical protein BV456_00980 [Thermoplasmata archaeon M8B2D]|nr:MAG: hypothetical protein BV456_00980 [Thermoplasmata archaeon M8B2D]
MEEKVLNDVYLVIGGEQKKYKANTLKMVYGAGTGNTRAMQLGGGKAKSLHSVDGSTRVGKMIGAFEGSVEAKLLVKKLLADRNAGIYTSVQLVDPKNGEPDILENAQFNPDPEINFAQDGEIAFEFFGDPMI